MAAPAGAADVTRRAGPSPEGARPALAEPETYADRGLLNQLLDERNSVEGLLQREYQEWEKLVDQQD